jgi:sulfur carrier protein ThiS adenylyltransferase
MSTPTERFSALIPVEKLKESNIEIIGCGAIGRQIALLITQLHPKIVTLYDFDDVAIENVGTQGYYPEDIGSKKVDALAAVCDKINPNAAYVVKPEKWEPHKNATLISFLCVDSMSARKSIAEQLLNPFIDCRMSARTGRVLYADPANKESIEAYMKTIHPDSESLPEPCHARSTPWCATFAASLAVSQFSKLMRNWNIKYLPSDLTFNMDTSEMFTSPAPEEPTSTPVAATNATS